MREVELRGVDLNLLVMLNALLEERSVTAASRRLGMSQPATSRALSRLRALLSDPLLVDGRAGYILSARAEQLRPEVRRVLSSIRDMLKTSQLDPAAETGQLRLMMPDLQAASLAPHLLANLANEAPALDLEILPLGVHVMQALEDDAADAAVGVFDEAPAGMLRRRLYDERLVTLLRSGHPDADRKLTLDRYLELDHIVVSITGVGPAPVDMALAAMGHQRRVKVHVPNFLAAVEIAARSNLVMTLPSSLAQTAAGTARLVALTPPIDLGRFTISLVWHAHHQDDPRHVWLRGKIVAAAAKLADSINDLD